MPVFFYAIVIEGPSGEKQALRASKSYTEHTKQRIQVANGAADSQLNFGGVTTADIVYLYSDQALTVNLNAASGTDITLDASHPMFLGGTAVTGIWVSNASGSTANLDYQIWGA